MKRRRHRPERMVRKVWKVDRLLGEGTALVEAGKHLEITEATYCRWRNQYGGMKADDARWLREWSLSRRLTSPCSRRCAGETSEPGRRRTAVDHLMASFEVSQRRACDVIEQPRSTQRSPRIVPTASEQQLRGRLRQFAEGKPSVRVSRLHDLLTREGHLVNHKRGKHLCCEEGLRVRFSRRKRARVGTPTPRSTPSTVPEPCVGARHLSH